jgi:hypothetical protein
VRLASNREAAPENVNATNNPSSAKMAVCVVPRRQAVAYLNEQEDGKEEARKEQEDDSRIAHYEFPRLHVHRSWAMRSINP